MVKSPKFPFFSSSIIEVVRGKLDVVSLTALTYLFVFMLFYTVWSKFFPEMYDLLSKLWLFATSGLIVHEIMWGSQKDLFFTSQKGELRKTVTLTGLAFSSIVIAQFAIIQTLGMQPKPLTGSAFQTKLFGAIGAAIAEEFAFAWFLFSFFLFLTKNLYISLFVNAIIFALFHSAVGYQFYMGMPAFFPAIFVSRLALDLVYYFSGGRITTSILAHGMINFSTVIAYYYGGAS